MKQKCELLICGDICPTPDTEVFYENGDAKGLFTNIIDLTREADVTIGNLEFPLTDIGRGIKKIGPVLKGKRNYIKVLKKAGFNVLGLANNHIRDCGNEGVISTLECCIEENIKSVGAGENLELARKPLIIEQHGWIIGIVAFAEHEFNAATKLNAGAYIFDVYYSLKEIQELKAKVDYLIVLNHGGIEHYAYPSPLLQTKCRALIEAGADFVTCQHSHCIGTEENYKGGRILYGQGNSLFGYREHNPSWNEGLLIRLTLDNNKIPIMNVEYIPIEMTNKGAVLASDSRSEVILNAFRERSKIVVSERDVNKKWDEFCELQKAVYLPLLFGLGRYITFFNRMFNNAIFRRLYSKKKLSVTYNLIRCESHNEVIKTILSK